MHRLIRLAPPLLLPLLLSVAAASGATNDATATNQLTPLEILWERCVVARPTEKDILALKSEVESTLGTNWSVQIQRTNTIHAEYRKSVLGYYVPVRDIVPILSHLGPTAPEEHRVTFELEVSDKIAPVVFESLKRRLETDSDLLEQFCEGIPHVTRRPMALLIDATFSPRDNQDRSDLREYRFALEHLARFPSLYTTNLAVCVTPPRISPSSQITRDYINSELGAILEKFIPYEFHDGRRRNAVLPPPPAFPVEFALSNEVTGVSYGIFRCRHGERVKTGKDNFILVSPSTSTNSIIAKMKRIEIPDIDFRQANVQDVIGFLQTASVEHDSSFGLGVTTLLALPRHKEVPRRDEPQRSDPFEPASGLPQGDLPSEVPLITFSARYISLYDAIQAVCLLADLDMQITNNMVLFRPAKPSSDEKPRK